MAARDQLARRTATPRLVWPWLAELTATLPGLVRSYAPGAPLAPRTREHIMVAVSKVNGCRYCAWVHGSWRAFLGEGAHDDGEEAVLAYARRCAEAGRPLPADGLATVLPPEALRAVRATVARIELASLVGNTFDGLVGRITGRRPLQPLALARETATVASALPVAVPMVATAAAMRLATRLAPPMPEIEVPAPEEANLLVHLVATATPAYLSNALMRIAVVGLPRSVAVGVRSGRTAATVRVGRGAVAIENGISDDAIVVVEGEVESLLQTATGSLVRELGGIRIRPS